MKLNRRKYHQSKKKFHLHIEPGRNKCILVYYARINLFCFSAPLKKFETGPIRNFADVDAELELLQM